MTQAKHPVDPAVNGRAILHEDDIGSGEKTPAEKETEEMIKEIPPLKGGGNNGGQPKQ
ncbi:hypothetical protein ACFPOU_08910 [Massilia jejuensis]|uniref:MARCKS family protein n=1 Tax=Massilia jejuensis TaxID=648894 RepID=A0ABW0PFP6_9BURK